MNGIIIINKEKGYTSHDVVAKVKKILNIKKVGHTGTLDPNATGVLPLLLNDGTKLSKYLINHDKEYIVTLKLGAKTDTADAEGAIIEEKEVKEIDEELITKTLNKFKGEQLQTPPIYSAIKVKGKKLYEYARSGQTVEIEPRKITIYDIELLSLNDEQKEIEFRVECSKGTYIRSLCEDIANKLETVGYMKELNRTRVGGFVISQAITLDELENNKNEIVEEKIITIEKLLKDLPSILLDNKQIDRFLNGVKIKTDKEDGTYNIYNCEDKYIGTGEVRNKTIKRDVIINQ